MIYAFNTVPEEWKYDVLSSLKEGTGRFGCMYDIREDLYTDDYIADRNKCKFLEDLEKDDYVIYINMPENGKCIIARVESGYYRMEPLDKDFNHCFKVEPESIKIFDRNSATVPSYLRRRLKLWNKNWKIFSDNKFDALVENLLNTPETEEPIEIAL
ncbi:MAG: hypothetical protein ABRQ27_02960 [Clostridiaceae bacterium]